jgi:hypothetical protein
MATTKQSAHTAYGGRHLVNSFGSQQMERQPGREITKRLRHLVNSSSSQQMERQPGREIAKRLLVCVA